MRVKQKNGAGYDMLAEFTYNGQHRPLTYKDSGGAITGFAWNWTGQLLSARYAFSVKAERDVETLGKYRQQWEALEGVRD